jgi:predicted Zn-dependent protease
VDDNLRARGLYSKPMIDSTTDPPNKETETVIEKLSKVIILAFLMAACASGPSATAPAPSETTKASEAPATTIPADGPIIGADVHGEEPGAGDDDTRREGDESDAADRSDEGDEGASPESGDEPAAEKKGARPGRIVLKTVYDDQRVGEEQRVAIEAEMGLVEDDELLAYVRSVGIRLLRYAPPRPFNYEFKVVDQRVPNAFALPGGKIYVSRGLLALVQSEDELAAVIGHEITHAAERHSAARMDYASRINPLSIGLMRAATIAAYGRDQERDADRGGQILCALAGYNPIGIATFLRKLDAADRYEIGWSRLPHFLSTHPTSPERSSLASDRAAGLVWERQPGIADDLPLGYYSMIDGLIMDDNPAGGLFEGDRFLHPDLRFAIRLPHGWTRFNTQQAVGAVSPNRDAEATLTVEGTGTDIEKVVEEFIQGGADGIRVKVRKQRRLKLGELPAIRIEGSAGNGLSVQMTFVAHESLVYRLSILSVASAESGYRGRARAFAHSFRPLNGAEIHSLEVVRLRIARALDGETLQALSLRTHNDIELVYTGVMNGIYAETPLLKGTPIKIGLAEPYIPKSDIDEQEVLIEQNDQPKDR